MNTAVLARRPDQRIFAGSSFGFTLAIHHRAVHTVPAEKVIPMPTRPRQRRKKKTGRIPDEVRARVVALKASGISVPEIEKKTGVSKRSVYRIAKEVA